MNITPPLPEAILLDLDDTILRFSAGQPDAWRIALETHCPDGTKVDAMLSSISEVTSEFWGNEQRAFWGRQNMFEARRIVAARALEAYGFARDRAHEIGDTMTRLKEEFVRPFDGAVSTLQALRHRGHRLGLLTNGSSEFQRRKLRRFELEQHFELILVEGEQGFGKPSAEFFNKALEFFKINAAQTVMIGDNLEADIQGAQSVGIPGIWHDCYQQGMVDDHGVRPARIIAALPELLRPQAGVAGTQQEAGSQLSGHRTLCG